MAYADALRTETYTGDDVADLIEGVASSGFPLALSTWAPTLGANNSMTFTSTTVDAARYVQIGKIVFFFVVFHGTVGGTPSTALTFTLPVTAVSTYTNLPLTASTVQSGGQNLVGCSYLSSTTVANVTRSDVSNWTAGSGTYARVQGFYEAA
jgi:hypothetical protein